MVVSDESSREIRIATLLSDRVKRGASHRFPVVYDSFTCHVHLDLSTDFGRRVRDRHIRELLRSERRAPSARRRVQRMYLKASLSELSRGVSHDALTRIMNDDGPYLTNALVSELCYSDINYFRGVADDASAFGDLVSQCFECLIELFRCGIVHGDVHFGNFLVKYTSDAPFVLIHDFDTSEECTRYEEFMWDAEKLLDAVLATGVFLAEIDVGLDIIRKVTEMSEVNSALRALSAVFRP